MPYQSNQIDPADFPDIEPILRDMASKIAPRPLTPMIDVEQTLQILPGGINQRYEALRKNEIPGTTIGRRYYALTIPWARLLVYGKGWPQR